MDMSFLKMHGLGNDFVVLDGRTNGLPLSGQDVRAIADRKRGVGCDQLIILEEPSDSVADVFMRIFNPDGTQAGACGNATRCVADILMNEKDEGKATVQTVAGLLYCMRGADGLITVDMGVPGLEWNEIPLLNQCDTLHLPLDGDPVGVSMGNPHCVFFCDNAEDINVNSLGAKIEHHELFPERTNVEYVSIQDENTIRMRVWERSAGVTQACGTGACAAAVASIRRGLTGRKVNVVLDGGDLVIEWREQNSHVYMTGSVTYVFEGTIEL